MEYQEIVDLYRQIGRDFRTLGAERVLLYRSKKLVDRESEPGIKMELSLLVFGCEKRELFQEHAVQLWPDIKVELMMENELMLNQKEELMEDGVFL